MENNQIILNRYLISLYQNVKTATQSLENLMPSVKNRELKKELQRQYNGYNSFLSKLQEYADDGGLKLKDNNIFEKMRLWIGVKMSAIMGKSVRDYVNSLLLGTVMGLTTLYKDKYDYMNINDKADELRDELEQIEEDNYNSLKELLKTNI